MRKLLALLIPLFLGASLFFVFQFLSNRQNTVTALQVTSTPTAEVFFDNRSLGKTPVYNDKLKPGDHTVKLIPQGNIKAFNFEQKVTLRPSILTVIDRVFKDTEAESETSIISLEEIVNKKDAQVAIATSPDGAEVKLDEQPQGVSPLVLKGISVSDHQLSFDSKGYNTKIIRIHPTQGYKLTISAKLGIQPESLITPTIQTQPQATASASVKILQTPTGFLRVRSDPSVGSQEVARVAPDEIYQLVDEQNDWYKIKLKDGKEGWISKQYAKKQ